MDTAVDLVGLRVNSKQLGPLIGCWLALFLNYFNCWIETRITGQQFTRKYRKPSESHALSDGACRRAVATGLFEMSTIFFRLFTICQRGKCVGKKREKSLRSSLQLPNAVRFLDYLPFVIVNAHPHSFLRCRLKFLFFS